MNIRFLSALIFSLLLISLVFAQTIEPEGKGRGKHSWLNKLNLTDAQKSKIKELRENHFSESAKLRDELAKLRIDKRALLRDENLNRSNYLELEKKMGGLREQIAELRADHQMDVYDLLTDEQKKEFRNSPMNMREHHQERFLKKGHRREMREEKEG